MKEIGKSVERALRQAVEIEHGFSACYENLIALAPDEASKRELHILSRDEFAHAELVRRGIQYVQAHPDLVGDSVFTEGELAAILPDIRGLAAAIEQKTVSYAAALRRLAEFEKSLYGVHMSHIAEIREPSLKTLFENLSAGDKAHIERVLKMIAALA